MALQTKISKLFKLLFVLVLAACQNADEAPAEESAAGKEMRIVLSDEQWQQENYHKIKLQERSFKTNIALTGRMIVSPANQYRLSPFYGGTVQGLKLQNGDLVEKGQTLFYLQGPELIDLQESYWTSKAEFQFSEANYRRQLDLRKDSIVSEKVFQEVEAHYLKAKASYASFREKMNLLGLNLNSLADGTIEKRVAVRAPQKGVISDLNISSGYFLKSNEWALSINDFSQPIIELRVFEKDLDQLHLGQNLSYYLPSNPAKTYSAEISHINPDFSKEGSALVYAQLNEDSLPSSLAHGMYLEAQLQTESTKAFSLPQSAVAERNGKYYALRVIEEDKQFSLQEVELALGQSTEGYIEVLSTNKNLSKYYFIDHGVFQLLED